MNENLLVQRYATGTLYADVIENLNKSIDSTAPVHLWITDPGNKYDAPKKLESVEQLKFKAVVIPVNVSMPPHTPNAGSSKTAKSSRGTPVGKQKANS